MGQSYTIATDQDGKLIEAIDFDYDAIDGLQGVEPETLLEAFTKAFEWIANVKPNDFRGMAIRVQTVRCILLQKDQTKMAEEIGVGKAAISQRMSDLRDHFRMRNPKANLRSEETRQKFSTQCTQRHQKKASLSSETSPTKSTTSSETQINSPLMPSVAAKPLSRRLYELANC
jgi:hypothetical protein